MFFHIWSGLLTRDEFSQFSKLVFFCKGLSCLIYLWWFGWILKVEEACWFVRLSTSLHLAATIDEHIRESEMNMKYVDLQVIPLYSITSYYLSNITNHFTYHIPNNLADWVSIVKVVEGGRCSGSGKVIIIFKCNPDHGFYMPNNELY